MVFTLSTVEIQYLQLQIFFTAGSWFLYPAFMISLQYIAIAILHVFWLPQKKKEKAAALRSCVVFMHEVCVSFGSNSEGNLPGAAGASMLPILSVSIRGVRDVLGGATSVRHPTAHLPQPVHTLL